VYHALSLRQRRRRVGALAGGRNGSGGELGDCRPVKILCIKLREVRGDLAGPTVYGQVARRHSNLSPPAFTRTSTCRQSARRQSACRQSACRQSTVRDGCISASGAAVRQRVDL
jgi:hypothetical protein